VERLVPTLLRREVETQRELARIDGPPVSDALSCLIESRGSIENLIGNGAHDDIGTLLTLGKKSDTLRVEPDDRVES